MFKTLLISLLTFYSLGTLFLPLGDFSTLQDIPEMYNHCKATEHRDMTALDFVTDRLINIDGIFDKHKNGDEQKPHSPIKTQHVVPTVAFQAMSIFPLSVKKTYASEKKIFPFLSDIYIVSDYISKLFRPPIVA